MSNRATYEELAIKVKELERTKSDHLLTTKALQDSEARFKALHDATFGGVIIHDKGVILDCNQGLSEMTGFTNNELIGMNGLELIAQDSLEEVLRNIKNGYEQQYDVFGVRKNGSEYPLAIRGKNIPYKGKEVRVIEFRDITERKIAEEAARSSETKFRELFEQSPIGLALCTMEGQLISVNPAYAKIIGYRIEEALKLSYWQITPEEYGGVEREKLAELQRKGRYEPYEKEYIHKNGHLVSVRLNGMNVLRNGENLIWSSVEDITALKKAEIEKKELIEQLRQSHKMEAIGTLAGGIAHDFNNILAAILGYADMALDDTPDNSPAKYDIEQVLKAGHRAKDLVKHILSFSRKEHMERAPIQIHLIVMETFKLLRATIPATIEIKHDIDTRCGYILADPTQIHQVLMNLCTNAAQSMDENGGVLEVGLNKVHSNTFKLCHIPNLPPGEYIQLSVRDNGVGIDQQHLNRIFDPYFTTKDTGKGSGMGLAVVMGIIRSHDGVITVDSNSGEGTTFNVYFPMIETQPLDSANDTTSLPLGNERVLLVDDEKAMVDMTKRIIERLGYQVTTKTGSREALELFRSQPNEFDIVISDQTMPGLTGGELAKQLLTIRPNIPIVICTGYSSKLNAKQAKTIGISGFIMKPVEKHELAITLRRALDERR